MDRGYTDRSATSANPDVQGSFANGFSPRDESVPTVRASWWMLGCWASLGDGRLSVPAQILELRLGRLSGNSSFQACGSGAIAPCGTGPSPVYLLLALCECGPVSLCPAGVSPGLWLRRTPFLTCAEPHLLNMEAGRIPAFSLWAAWLSLVQLVASPLQQPSGPCGVPRCRAGQCWVPIYILHSLMPGALKTVLCVFDCFRGTSVPAALFCMEVEFQINFFASFVWESGHLRSCRVSREFLESLRAAAPVRVSSLRTALKTVRTEGLGGCCPRRLDLGPAFSGFRPLRDGHSDAHVGAGSRSYFARA